MNSQEKCDYVKHLKDNLLNNKYLTIIFTNKSKILKILFIFIRNLSEFGILQFKI